MAWVSNLLALCLSVCTSTLQRGQLLSTQFPQPPPRLPAPLVQGRATWLVLANVLRSEVTVRLFRDRPCKSWCAALQPPLLETSTRPWAEMVKPPPGAAETAESHLEEGSPGESAGPTADSELLRSSVESSLRFRGFWLTQHSWEWPSCFWYLGAVSYTGKHLASGPSWGTGGGENTGQLRQI